jgi:MFS family permease
MSAGGLDSKRSWTVAFTALGIISLGFGTPYVSVVALTQLASEIGNGARAAPALANALATLGAATGGIAFGWLSDRIGIFWPLVLGAIAIGLGCALSSIGGEWAIYIGHGLLIGFFGIGAIYAPLVTMVSRWFDRRRGTALSLVASGQQVAGAVWPPLFGITIDRFGWRPTILWFGILNTVLILALARTLWDGPPIVESEDRTGGHIDRLEGANANLFLAILCAAIVGCCVAMSMPMSHLVAYCGDLSLGTGRGTEMLALLLGSAFFSRILWGRLSDEIGGLKTVLIGTICQAFLLAAFIFISSLYGLFIISAAFGFGFGGIIPSYILAVRELFPSKEAGSRIAILLFFSLAGMALGSWLGGYIFDRTLDYRWAFTVGVAFNVMTIALVIGLLCARDWNEPVLGSRARS